MEFDINYQAVYKFIKNNDSFPESIRNLIQRINIQLGHIKKKKQKVERAQSVQQQQKKKKKIINLFKKEDSDKSPLSSESSEDSDDDNEDPQVIRPKTSNLQQKGNKDKKITIVAIPDDQSKRPKTVDNRLQAHRNSKLLQNLEAFQILNKANQPKVKSKFKDEFSKDKGISIWSYFQQKYGMTMKFTESEQIQNTKQKSKLLSDLTGVHDNQGQQNNTGQNSTGKFSQASPCLVKQSVVKQYENNRQQQKTQDDMTSPRMTRQSSNQQSNIKSVNKYSTFYSNQRQSQGQNEIKGQSKEYVTNLQGKTSFLEDVKNQRHRAVQQINDQQRLDLKMSLRKKNSFYHSSDSEIEEDRQEKRVIVHNLLKSNFNTNNEVNVGKVFEPNFDLRDQLEDRGLWQPKPAKIPIKKVVKKKKVQQNLQYEDKHDIYNIIKIAISDQKKLTKIKDFNNRQRKQFFETIKDMDPDFLDDCIQMEEIGQKKKDYNKNILEKVKIVTPNSFRRTKDNRLIIIPPNTQLSKNDVKLRYMEYYVDQALQRLNLC